MKKLLFITLTLLSLNVKAQTPDPDTYNWDNQQVNAQEFAIQHDVNGLPGFYKVMTFYGHRRVSILCDSLILNGTVITPQRLALTQAGVKKVAPYDSLDFVHFKQAYTYRAVPYSGVSDTAGFYTVTFPVAYLVAPNIQANIVNQSDEKQFLKINSVSEEGFTISVYKINNFSPFESEIVEGVEIDVLITEK